ncbi:MAG: hypothetical protein WDM90_21100 [Ferruginibacter sp.]
MKTVKILWIDDMEDWATTARTNLSILAEKYEVDLHIISAKNGEDVVQQLMMFDFDGCNYGLSNDSLQWRQIY